MNKNMIIILAILVVCFCCVILSGIGVGAYTYNDTNVNTDDSSGAASTGAGSCSTDIVFTGDNASPGDIIKQCNGLKSSDGKFKLIMQADGNLVLYKDTNSIWVSNTYGQGKGPYEFRYQTDGNLVVYDANNKPLWKSDTTGKSSNKLTIQTDGNVVLYNNTVPVWSTRTSPLSCWGPDNYYVTKTDTISPGYMINQCDGLKSSNSKYKLVMQSDGNLVLYNDKNSIWSSRTNSQGIAPYNFRYQSDGNLVIYDANNKSLWSSKTNGKTSTKLKMQDDGNLVLYNGTSAIWSTETAGK